VGRGSNAAVRRGPGLQGPAPEPPRHRARVCADRPRLGRDSRHLRGAGCVIGLLNITGLALGLGLSLVKLGENSVPLLLVAVAVISIILGMGLPTTGVYLLVALLAAPPLVKLGVRRWRRTCSCSSSAACR